MTRDAWRAEAVARIGKAVQDARRSAGLSQEDLAQRIGSSRNAIQNLEAPRGRKISFDVLDLMEIARTLGVPPVALLYPDLPDGPVEVWPGHTTRSILGVKWFSGELTMSQASDYLPEFDEVEQDRQAENIKKVERARELETLKSQLALADWDQYLGGDKEHAEQLFKHARDRLVHFVAAVISRGWYIDRSGDSTPQDVLTEADKIVRRRGQSDGR